MKRAYLMDMIQEIILGVKTALKSMGPNQIKIRTMSEELTHNEEGKEIVSTSEAAIPMEEVTPEMEATDELVEGEFHTDDDRLVLGNITTKTEAVTGVVVDNDAVEFNPLSSNPVESGDMTQEEVDKANTKSDTDKNNPLAS